MHEQEPSLQETLLNEAYSDFFSKEKDEKENEPYSIYHACEFVIKKHQLDPVKLLPNLFKNSSFLPKDIFEILGRVDPETTWIDFAMHISYIALGFELRRRFPDAHEEENRRFDNF